MFVIKHGNALIQKECPKCSCVFAFDYSDICEEWHKDDDDDYVGIAYVCCPECGRKISWPIRKTDNTEDGGVPIEYSKCGQPLYRLWRRGPNL